MLAFLLFCSFLSFSARAQYNLVKLHLAQLPFGQTGIAYEKVFDRQFSVQLNAQAMWPNKGQNFITRRFISDDALRSSSLFGYAFTLESRAYTYEARSDAWKWYLGLFLRYSNYELESTFDSGVFERRLSGSLTNASGGFELGINYIYLNKWSFDVCFMGVGFARNELEVELETSEPDPNIGEIEDGLRSIPIIGSRILLQKEEPNLLRFSSGYGTLALRISVTVGMLF